MFYVEIISNTEILAKLNLNRNAVLYKINLVIGSESKMTRCFNDLLLFLFITNVCDLSSSRDITCYIILSRNGFPVLGEQNALKLFV